MRSFFLKRYANWLHLRWPAGKVEKLPITKEDGSTNIPGVYVTGDLRGVPLLKFSADTGAKAVRAILDDPSFHAADKSARDEPESDGVLDLVIIGAGISGVAAALEAKKAGLRFEVIEANEPFSTIANFPRGKPIYTYPKDMKPAGDLELTADVKEDLLEELTAQASRAGIEPVTATAKAIRRRSGVLEVELDGGEPMAARRVIVAIGRSGNYRTLGVPGEDTDKVYNRLYDPRDYTGMNVLVVGGGDSALETAAALAQCGADVTLSYRKKEFSRPKPENIEKVLSMAHDGPRAAREDAEATYMRPAEKPGSIDILLGSRVKEIRKDEVIVETADGETRTIPNDVVFTLIGREPPLDFFRRSGIRISGEWTKGKIASFAAFFLFCLALYNWKSGGALSSWSAAHGLFPFSLMQTFAAAAADPRTLVGTLVISASGPAFWYTLAYSLIVVLFGIRRIRRRKTPYITAQTITLMSIQVLPLFLLPEIILPLLGHNGLLPAWLTNALFPPVDYGHGYEFWRAYGLILAWPLNVYNVFTSHPLPWWLVIAVFQTLVFIPLIIYYWGKGAYCGWICSCGALAETLGDGQRHKMPHGPLWNRLNLIGQGILALAVILLFVRIAGWLRPQDTRLNEFFDHTLLHDYKWGVDVFLAGVVGYGAYFWLSGRVWCRFLCPLAALMHIYARFGRFRILADKKKCISCNLCTGICHQGIDVMSFANKGLPMSDPECVRCSACLHICPTGVLSFGMIDKEGNVIRTDKLEASPARMTGGE
jgi:thioredoxin reductase/polyferredoxin